MASQFSRVLPTVKVTQTLSYIDDKHPYMQLTVDVSLFQRDLGDPAPFVVTDGPVELPAGVQLTLPPTANLGLNLYLASGQVDPKNPKTARLKPIDGSFVSLPVPAFSPATKVPYQFELGSHGFPLPNSIGSSNTTLQAAGFLTISNLDCDAAGGPLASAGGLLTSPCEWQAPGRMRFWSRPLAGNIELWQRNVMDYMMKVLTERGYSFTSSALVEIERDIRQRVAYLRQDLIAAIERESAGSDLGNNYTLPDGQVITIGDPRFTCPEIIFKPSLIGLREDGIGLLDDPGDIPTDMPGLRRYISEHQAVAITLHDGFLQIHRPVSG